MHEQAKLTKPFLAAGRGVGELVSISEVEKHFKTSAAANAALSFACSECDVPVGARIIQPYVPNRKVTPSSGFRASDQKRPHTCDRVPSPTEQSPTALGSAPAHPSQRSAPERWVDPRKAAASTDIFVPGRPTTTGGAGTSSGGRNGPASGQSVGQSQTVEKFAREWREMSSMRKKSTPLAASWNEQGRGSYFSAFHPLGYFPTVTMSKMAIYEGTAQHVIVYPDGYKIELNECPSGGGPLYIWISSTCLSIGAAGTHLASQLSKLSKAAASPTPVYIYALGQFIEWSTHAPNQLVLDIEHPHMCWIE